MSFRAAIFIVAALVHASAAIAQQGIVGGQTGSIRQVTEAPEFGFRNGSVVGAPIPFQNPMIGTGLALGVGYLFQTDAGSDPSTIGAGAMRSDNGSRAAGASVTLNFLNNRWQIAALYAQADLNYDLVTPGFDLPLEQSGVLGRLALSYGVTPDLSFGGFLRYLDTTISTNLALLPPRFRPSLDLEVVNIGAKAEWDLRDDTFYPTTGSRLQVAASQGIILQGVLDDYTKAYSLFDIYRPLGAQSVVAARAAICGASLSTPFYDQCSVGATDAFRGFNVTQMLGARMISAQIEYRQRLGNRFGFVVFAGAGAVGDRFGDLNNGGQAAGIGLRYRVSKKFPVDFAVDASLNDDGENLLYISVGQRF